MKQHQLLLGAHLSIAGGLEKAILAAPPLGCSCLQMFTHSNRQWKITPISPEQKTVFDAVRQQVGIDVIVVHASYLINLASPDSKTRALSQVTLKKELERCELLDIPILVLHPGASLSQGRDKGMDYVSEALEKTLKEVPGKSVICLELMAGQGSVLGATLEELAAMRAAVSCKSRIGFCLDTCHAFAAGYDFTTPAAYKAFWGKLDAVLGLKHLKVIHLNDSKGKVGSHLDRHANIGKGEIGLEAFRLIMNDSQLSDIPKILETPYETQQDYEKDLGILRGLMGRR